MRKKIFVSILFAFLLGGISIPAQALDPVAPRSERKFGMIYIKTPNATDVIKLKSLKGKGKEKKLSPVTDVKVRVGDYRVIVAIKGGYVYEQDVIVRATERHEVIVPGYGNVRVNGSCNGVTVLQGGEKKAEIKCGEIRTLPRGPYDIRIQIGKYTLNQSVTVVTNTLREIDIK